MHGSTAAEEYRIVWEPSDAQRRGSQMAAFIGEAAARSGLDLRDYGDLWEWSIEDRAGFWSALWDFTGVVAGRKPDHPFGLPGVEVRHQAQPAACIGYRQEGLLGIAVDEPLPAVVRPLRLQAAQGDDIGQRLVTAKAIAQLCRYILPAGTRCLLQDEALQVRLAGLDAQRAETQLFLTILCLRSVGGAGLRRQPQGGETLVARRIQVQRLRYIAHLVTGGFRPALSWFSVAWGLGTAVL